MAAFKNKNNGTWYVQFRYTDWKGERQQKLKRGFATKKEALAWEREFLMQKQADIDMTFESFVELYEKDVKPKLKLNTWLTKESIIKKKILPYFAKRKLSEITAKDIIHWQNEIRELTDWHGKPLSKTYLKTVHNQLSAICSGHYIREQELNAILLDDIRRVTHFARQNELRFAEHIRKKQGKEAQQEIAMLQKKIDTMQKRQVQLTKLFKRLYEDSVLDRIPDEQYCILSQEYTAEQKEIQEQLPAMEVRLQELKDSSSNIARFIENAKRYSEIPELTAEILRIFIKRVEVGERTEKNTPAQHRRRYASTIVTSAWWTNCLRVWQIPWQKKFQTRFHEQKREAVPKHSLPPQEQILSYMGRFTNCPYGTPEKGWCFFLCFLTFSLWI